MEWHGRWGAGALGAMWGRRGGVPTRWLFFVLLSRRSLSSNDDERPFPGQAFIQYGLSLRDDVPRLEWLQSVHRAMVSGELAV